MTQSSNDTVRRNNDEIQVRQIMPGADIICCGDHQLALGFPEEVVKAWLSCEAHPTAWLVPDVRLHDGVVQWAFEFPLYFALFVQNRTPGVDKIPVLIHERDWPDLVAYLRLTLLGLTPKEMLREGVNKKLSETLARETEHLALKRPDGSVAQIEDFLEPHFYDEEATLRLGGLEVRSHGDNVFSFFSRKDRIEEYRLSIEGRQQPPYERRLEPGNAPVLPQPFEVVTLGTGSGFDVQGPCCSTLVQANGRFMLVDCGPYILSLLNHAGLSVNQLSALVITHAHEDHAVGLSALLDLTQRIKLYITPETAAILRRKLAILNPGVNRPQSLLDDAFEVVLVNAGKDYDLFGLRLRFHYTMHPLPCVGLQLSMHDGARQRRVLIVGDNNSRQGIAEAAQQGVIDERRHAELEKLFSWRGDLLVADAGQGLIHGAPTDFADNPSANVICVHTCRIDPAQRHLFTLAKPGHRYTIVAEHDRPTPLERGVAHRALARSFDVGSDTEWLSVLLDAGRPLSVNRGHIVVRQGECSDDLFVPLTGELSVLVATDDGSHKVATIHAGEVFGEMAGFKGEPRPATVIAATPARLLRIPGALFRRFAQEARLASQLSQLWSKRADLEQVGVLASASVTTRTHLARFAVRRVIEPGATIIREGSRS